VVDISPEQAKQLEGFASEIFLDLTSRYREIGEDVAKQAAMAAAGDMVGFAPLLSKINDEGAAQIPVIVVEALKESALTDSSELVFKCAFHQDLGKVVGTEELQGWIIGMGLLANPVVRATLYAHGYRFKFAGAAPKDVTLGGTSNGAS